MKFQLEVLVFQPSRRQEESSCIRRTVEAPTEVLTVEVEQKKRREKICCEQVNAILSRKGITTVTNTEVLKKSIEEDKENLCGFRSCVLLGHPSIRYIEQVDLSRD